MCGKKINCQDKAAYISAQKARAAIVQAYWVHGKNKRGNLGPYLCKNCRLYHISTRYDDV